MKYRLRTLNEKGLLQRVRYVSANSGATWVTVPLAAKELINRLDGEGPFPYELYLGKYVSPEDIRGVNEELGAVGSILAKSNILADPVQQKPDVTVDAKRRQNNNVFKPLQNGFVNYVARPAYGIYLNFNRPKANFTAWVDAIDSNFVKTMDIPSSNREFYNKLQRAYLWKNDKRHLQPSEFPFPIYVATAYPEGDKPGIAVPFEFTPFYAGIPMDPRIFKDPDFDIGGGLLEYHVFNTTVNMPPIPFQANDKTPYLVQLPAPEKILNIAEVTGISSSFVGAMVVDLGLRQKVVNTLLRFLPGIPNNVKKFANPTKYSYWSPESGGPSRGLSFVDGGLYDNTGVLALLRRNCSCIIACVATDSAIYDADPKTNGERFSDIAALFGQQQDAWIDVQIKRVSAALIGAGSPSRRLWRRALSLLGWKLRDATRPPIPPPNDFQVFPADKWKVLVEELSEKYNKGVPQVVKMNLEVIENPKAGVFGNRTVDLIVCFNGRVINSWRDKLTREDLKKAISPSDGSEKVGPEAMYRWLPGLKKRTELSDYFPYFSTFRVIYDNITVNMMAHLSSFALKQGLEDVKFNLDDYFETTSKEPLSSFSRSFRTP